ncbi:MAG: alpha/beta hydrolase [Ignavibacteriae bacterium]|nr:alpha/beta hydrolase [Ignavibacteriota bacterium]
MPTITANDTTLEYVERGNGNPLVFVHGSVSDYRTWNAQLDAFAPRYRVIAYSRRYHHPNRWDSDGSDYHVSLHADDLSAMIREAQLGRAHVIGSSFGAYAALLTAIRHPEQVRTLVLGEPPVLPLLVENPDNPMHILALMTKSPGTGIQFLKFGLSAMKPAQKAFRQGDLGEGVRLFINGVLGKGGFDRLPPAAQTTMMDNAQALKAELLGPGFDRFPINDALRCEIPTLFVCGDRSPGFFTGITDRLLQILPNAHKVTIPNSSHSIHRDNPEQYNKQVLEFLAKHA